MKKTIVNLFFAWAILPARVSSKFLLDKYSFIPKAISSLSSTDNIFTVSFDIIKL